MTALTNNATEPLSVHHTARDETVRPEAVTVARQGNSLRSNISWVLAGNLVFSVCRWGFLIALSKLGGQEMVGQLAVAIAVVAPIFMLANLQLKTLQAVDARDEYAFGDFFGLRLATTGLAYGFVILFVLFGDWRIETKLVILCFGLSKAAESFSDIVHGLLQKHERMERIGRSFMLRGVLSLIALSGLLYLTRSSVLAIAGLAFGSIVVFAWYDLKSVASMARQMSSDFGNDGTSVARLILPTWRWSTIRKLVPTALPLGLLTMMLSLYNNLPSLFIEKYLGEESVGLFAAIAYFLIAESMVLSALISGITPRLAKHLAAGNQPAFARLLGKQVIVGTSICLAGVACAGLLGEELLSILYSSNYAAGGHLFVTVMWAGLVYFYSILLGYALIPLRFNYTVVGVFSIAPLGLTCGSYVWIPQYGLAGAASAMFYAALAQAICCTGIVLFILSRIDLFSTNLAANVNVADMATCPENDAIAA